ncbi:MAG TPA: Re/Si-specific NAD(P)(+) transhydrogenase subunit alpha [Gemmatimonadaceae bacterium]|nr:Re/Si-specific NAD(P)(+) transhydrogenase subunit alpha [Gemmatimonadaceae bacterium]
MRIHVVRETAPGERRVALVPDVVQKLVKSGHHVTVEHRAGTASGLPDVEYAHAGARVIEGPGVALAPGDLIVRVRPPSDEEIARLPRGVALVGMLDPLGQPTRAQRLADAGVDAFALEFVPRITRAQTMDVLSSQANLAGYRAVLEAAQRLPKIFPMMMTAAGTIPPAKVLVLGVGVAGLQAIATAKRLGAVVRAFDIRPVVKEQVESLGAQFVGITIDEAEAEGGYAKEVSEDVHRREQELLSKFTADSDVVVTTAQVPGRRAPVLVTRAMVESMQPGSVIVDLAADSGGNCELTRNGEEVDHGGVLVVALSDAASGAAANASRVYARNVEALLELLIRDGKLAPKQDDEIVAAVSLTRDGRVVHPRLSSLTPDA